MFHSLSASNQTCIGGVGEGAARHARRLVEKTFRFIANDRKGHMAGHIKCVSFYWPYMVSGVLEQRLDPVRFGPVRRYPVR